MDSHRGGPEGEAGGGEAVGGDAGGGCVEMPVGGGGDDGDGSGEIHGAAGGGGDEQHPRHAVGLGVPLTS